MKASTFCLCLIAAGLFVFTVALAQGPTWLAVVGIVAAYGAAGAYRHATRTPRTRKGARK